MKRVLPIFIWICIFFTPAANGQNLIDAEFKGSISLQEMVANYGFLMQYGVDMYKITYETPDVFGQIDTASGLIVIPIHDEPLAFPLLSYQHGTVNGPFDVPSNLQGGYELATVFAGVGYVTTAADFLGLGESRGFHPYVHADSEASAAIDMLFAARQYAEQNDLLLNDQLFISGYSQGGHAAAAVHREIEANYTEEFTVTASSPMSGPYSISGEMRDVILSETPYFFPAYAPYTVLSYDYVYDLFDDVDEVFKQPYATVIEQFYEGSTGLFSLNSLLITQLENLTGESITRRLFQDSIISEVENNLEHPINIALRANDVYDWTPQAPTRLMYCQADDQVIYTNSIVADSVMNENGATNVMAVNVNPDFNHGQCVEPATISTLLFFSTYQDILTNTPEIEHQKIEVFPNPAFAEIQLQGLTQEADYQLYNVQGALVGSGRVKTDRASISVSHLPKGSYFLKVNWESGQLTEKVILQ
ncbi:MAG: T9SS type A sorting domain-containing protein [Saprospiraceae bacterium]|nr:T9SS type A sorting domain-containing protein [Saprospiraceae bacterium]